MRKFVVTSGVIGVALVSFAVFLNVGGKVLAPEEAEKQVIRIGASLPLSGNMAHVGQSAQNAMQMSLERWKTRGTKYDYELIVEDDAFEAKKVATITNKLIDIDKAKALLTVFSIGANVASPITGSKGVIHLTCAYGEQPAEGFYNFNNITQYEPQTQLMVDTLKNKGVKTLAMLISNNIGSTQQADMLEKKIREDGTIKIVAKEVFNPGTRNFRMMIQKIVEGGEPDMFYVDGITPDAALVAKYLREVTGKLNLTTINDFIEDKDRAPFEGLWFVESASGTQEFIEKYEEKHHQNLYLCGANSHDNLDVLIWAYEYTPKRKGELLPNNDDVVETILGIKDWHGAIGTFTVNKKGIMSSKPSLRVINNGRPKPYLHNEQL